MRIIMKLTASPPKPIEGPIGQALALLLLGFVGSVVVWIWQEKRLQKAFYLGIGLPALIQVGTLQDSVLPQKAPSDSEPLLLIASASAAEEPGNNSFSGRRLAVIPRSKDAEFAVVFFDSGKHEFSTRT
ncbi:MAG: hypothetical protein WAO00_05160, partial [Chthoniobacterales bacterium]